jgi:hypothetical protein
MAKTIEEYAKLAARDTQQWYGATRSFTDKNPRPAIPCTEFFVQHWTNHPTTSPMKKEVPHG